MSALGQGLVVGVVAGCLLAACATPEPKRPEVVVPSGWKWPSTSETSLGAMPWGEVFQSKELDALIDEALVNNSDLRIAADRVEVARAEFGFQRSFLFPAVGGQASYLRQRVPGPGESNVFAEASTLGLAVPTWEIDLWGRLRSATEASRRQLLAREDVRRAVYTSLVAQVATGYLSLLDLDTQIEVASRTAASRRESLRLIDLRYRAGVASRLDINDQISLVAQAERAIANLERLRTASENALSTLIGRNPGPIARERKLPEHELPPALPAGLPSTLLARRYDILAAEETLYSADANIDAARKAFFPTISLTAFVGVASPALRDLFDSGRYAWSASPSLLQPIFNAGRLQSNLEGAQANQRIAVEEYKRAIRNAFREVEDGLSAYQRINEERLALAASVNANRERVRLSDLRYKAGVAAYFEVLDASRQLFDAELALIQATSAQYRTVILLYQALGGGFDAAAASESMPMPSGPYSPPSPDRLWWF